MRGFFPVPVLNQAALRLHRKRPHCSRFVAVDEHCDQGTLCAAYVPLLQAACSGLVCQGHMTWRFLCRSQDRKELRFMVQKAKESLDSREHGFLSWKQ